MTPGRCEHCGWKLQPLARAGAKYCSDRCRKRAQRHLPYVGNRKNWTPLHPVDEPTVRYLCLNVKCRAPIFRRNQVWCSRACAQHVRRTSADRYRPGR